MDENFSRRVKDVIQYSKEEAVRLGHVHIGTEHLILGMIREGECMAIEILVSLGVDIKLLRKSIEEVSISSLKSGSSERSNLPLTKQAEKALKTTFLEAKIFDSDIIGTPHLLLCVLRNESDPIYQLLFQQGITYDVVKEHLNPEKEMNLRKIPSLKILFQKITNLKVLGMKNLVLRVQNLILLNLKPPF
jgi:ATP-dependent Clp protease ATP-binding subunit ClpC